MKKRKEKIELLNSEGPILVATKLADGGFRLEFTQDNFSCIFGKKHFRSFISGTLPFVVPNGKK